MKLCQEQQVSWLRVGSNSPESCAQKLLRGLRSDKRLRRDLFGRLIAVVELSRTQWQSAQLEAARLQSKARPAADAPLQTALGLIKQQHRASVIQRAFRR